MLGNAAAVTFVWASRIQVSSSLQVSQDGSGRVPESWGSLRGPSIWALIRGPHAQPIHAREPFNGGKWPNSGPIATLRQKEFWNHAGSIGLLRVSRLGFLLRSQALLVHPPRHDGEGLISQVGCDHEANEVPQLMRIP